jgi:hypothetical protein
MKLPVPKTPIGFRAGEWICCTNGHRFCQALVDIEPGDKPGEWGDCFGNFQGRDKPYTGEPLHEIVCMTCGELIFHPLGDPDGWMGGYDRWTTIKEPMI